MREIAFHYGENNRGFGLLTLPALLEQAPVAVLFNAGVLHRSEPYRLNVLVSRVLAELGYIALRVDLSGMGDTPARAGLSERQSVALDWRHIKAALAQRFGARHLILMGLCSGADNSIKIAAQDPDVRGLILMDAVSRKDSGFAKRDLFQHLKNPAKWTHLPSALIKKAIHRHNGGNSFNGIMDLRDEPNDQDLQNCFQRLVASEGRVLAIFTNAACGYYNQQGQFSLASGIPGLEKICDELFWPHVHHLYPVQAHRDQLVHTICQWAARHFDRFSRQEDPSILRAQSKSSTPRKSPTCNPS